MKFHQPAVPVFVLFLIAFFGAPLAFVGESSQCPGLPEGSYARTNDCIMVGGTPCMMNLDPSVCAGTVNPDYPDWGPLVWISGTCYCPYTLADKCYGKYADCKNGCDPKTGACMEEEPASGNGGNADSGTQMNFVAYTSMEDCLARCPDDYAKGLVWGCDEAYCGLFDKPKENKCSSTCESGQKQNDYPDCSCIAVEKKCTNTCGENEARTQYPECKCSPISKCRNVKCDDTCVAQKRDYDIARTNGECNPKTGECEYEERKCLPNTCFLTPMGKAVCKEECDNGIDDDGNGLADCEDAACKQSLYCFCPRVASNGKAGTPLKILVGGWDYPPAGAFYTSADRDKETSDDAARIAKGIFSTVPFSEFPVEVYATRLPTGTLGPWRSDLFAKCKEAGGDITLFMRYTGAKAGSSRLYSMNVEMAKNFDPYSPNFERIAVHELGHAIGGLWDEYVIAESYGTVVGTLAYFRDYGFSTRANCDPWTTLGSCTKYFDAFNVSSYTCFQGCSAALWYRSSENSIMNDHTTSEEFNEVSEKLLRRRINAYLNPGTVKMEYDTSGISAGYDPSNPQLER